MKKRSTSCRKNRRKTAALKKVVSALAVTSSLVGATLSATAGPAAADTIVSTWGPVYFTHVSYGTDSTQRCLDDSSAGLRAFACNGMNYQNWHINHFADGTFELLNYATGNCMDDSPTAHLRAFACNGGWGGYQKWKSPRENELQNVATGLCLDWSPDYQLRTTGCNGGWNAYQDWYLHAR